MAQRVRKPKGSKQSTLSKALFAKSQNVKVFVRFRPVNKIENSKAVKSIQDPGISYDTINSITVPSIHHGQLKPKRFTFDGILKPNTSQQEAFNAIAKQTCDDILEGYNGTIFVYGQTGSGKTHTMYGPEKAKDDIKDDEKEDPKDVPKLSPKRSSQSSRAADAARNRARSRKQTVHAVRLEDDPENMGVIPMSVSYIFNALNDKDNEKLLDMKGYTIRASFIEIYNDKLYDLIDPSQSPELRFDAEKQMGVVAGITEEVVTDFPKMLKLITKATGNRTTSATDMNATSSRSHLILRLKVTIIKNDATKIEGIGNFADLAGSESQKKTGAKGDRFTEAKNINKSLSVLKRVIEALSKGRKHVPYKECELTKVLQDSLGGNCKTTLLVAASPHIFNRNETINSLQFGSDCKKIKNKAILNMEMTPEQLRMQIEELQKENQMLRESKMAVADEVVKQDLQNQVEINQSLEQKLKAIESALNGKDEELISLNSQKEEIETELQAKKEEVERLEEKTQELSKTVETLEQKVTSNKEENEALSAQNESFTKEIEKLQSDISNLTHEKEQLKIANDSYQREKDSNASKIENLETQITQLESMQREKISEVIGQKDNESKEEILNIEKKYKEITNTIQTQLDKTNEKYDKLNKQYLEMETLKSKLELEYNKLKVENESLKNENNGLKLEISKLKQELSDERSKYHQLESDHSDLLDKYQLLEEKYNELERNFEEMRHMRDLKTSQYNDLKDKYDDALNQEKAKRNLIEKQNIELKEETLRNEVNRNVEHQKELTETKIEINKLQNQADYFKHLYEHSKQLQIEQDRKLAEKLNKDLQLEAALEELRRKLPGMDENILREAAIKRMENVSITHWNDTNNGNNDNNMDMYGNDNNNNNNNYNYNGNDNNINNSINNDNDDEYPRETQRISNVGEEGAEGDIISYVTRGAEEDIIQRMEDDRKEREKQLNMESEISKYKNYIATEHDKKLEKQKKREEKLRRKREKEEEKRRKKIFKQKQLEEKKRKLRAKTMLSEKRLRDLEYEKRQHEERSKKLQQHVQSQSLALQQQVLRANAPGVQLVGISDDESSSDDPVRLG